MTRITSKVAADPITSADMNTLINKIQTTNATGVDNDVAFARVFNVRNYGATGDGVTDDSAAIQAAIDALVDAGAGVLFISAGDYLVDPLTVTLANNMGVIIEGAGFGSVLTSRTAGVMLTVDLGTSNYQGLILRNLRFDLNGLDSGALNLQPAGQHSRIENIWIDNNSVTATTTIIDIDQNSHALSLRDVRIRGGSATADGIRVAGNAVTLDALDITGCQNAVTIHGSVATVSGLFLLNSRLDSNVRAFFCPTRSALNIVIAHNRIEANTGSAIEIIGFDASTNRVFGVTIRDNYFSGLNDAARDGITLFRVNSVLIERNHFKGTGNVAEAVTFTASASNVYLRCNSVDGVLVGMTGFSGVPFAVSDVTLDQWSLASVVKASVVTTASLPVAAAAQDGRIVIEDAGAGDRNIIIYAGGQRFRIDGGAAF